MRQANQYEGEMQSSSRIMRQVRRVYVQFILVLELGARPASPLPAEILRLSLQLRREMIIALLRLPRDLLTAFSDVRSLGRRRSAWSFGASWLVPDLWRVLRLVREQVAPFRLPGVVEWLLAL